MAEKYLRKGNILYVEGKIRTDKYTDSEGIEKQIKKIRVLQMQMMGGMNRQENEDGFSERSNGSSSEGYEQEQKSYNNSDDYRHEPNDPKEDELPF
jgi:single-strand DNA-binding protein